MDWNWLSMDKLMDPNTGTGSVGPSFSGDHRGLGGFNSYNPLSSTAALGSRKAYLESTSPKFLITSEASVTI
jgi:hypothetical protein